MVSLAFLSETHLYAHKLTGYVVSDFRRYPHIIFKSDSDMTERKRMFKIEGQGRVKE